MSRKLCPLIKEQSTKEKEKEKEKEKKKEKEKEKEKGRLHTTPSDKHLESSNMKVSEGLISRADLVVVDGPIKLVITAQGLFKEFDVVGILLFSHLKPSSITRESKRPILLPLLLLVPQINVTTYPSLLLMKSTEIKGSRLSGKRGRRRESSTAGRRSSKCS
jgi:hypothetical protein